MELKRIGELNSKLKGLLSTVEAKIASVERDLLSQDLVSSATVPLRERMFLKYEPIVSTKGFLVLQTFHDDWDGSGMKRHWQDKELHLAKDELLVSILQALPGLLKALEEKMAASIESIEAVSDLFDSGALDKLRAPSDNGEVRIREVEKVPICTFSELVEEYLSFRDELTQNTIDRIRNALNVPLGGVLMAGIAEGVECVVAYAAGKFGGETWSFKTAHMEISKYSSFAKWAVDRYPELMDVMARLVTLRIDRTTDSVTHHVPKVWPNPFAATVAPRAAGTKEDAIVARRELLAYCWTNKESEFYGATLEEIGKQYRISAMLLARAADHVREYYGIESPLVSNSDQH